jgi:nucleotide-binding universal stress UspA family protein
MAYGAAMPLPYDLDLDASSRRALDQVIVETLGADPEVKIVSTVVEGQAAVELVRAAQGADLLVVGSRGHSAFAGMLLGSVSEHCAAHAPCPVVVVRAPEHPGA